jgi:apolipoprotein N-acyltransferase
VPGLKPLSFKDHSKRNIFLPLIYSLVSGLLLFIAWPLSPFTILIFVAFVPLFLVAELCSRWQFYILSYITFLTWNIASTYWIHYALLVGGIVTILSNSLLMCIPWVVFYTVRFRLGRRPGYIFLICFWLSFEYFHLNWVISFPWLNLGNAFSIHPRWIQWYEYTGISGGSLWILLVNIAIFAVIVKRINHGRLHFGLIITAGLMLGVPFLISYYAIDPFREKPGAAHDIVLVQPAIDINTEKYVEEKQASNFQRLIDLSKSQVDTGTALLVWPESILPEDINENNFWGNNDIYLDSIARFLKQYPHLNLIVGGDSYRKFIVSEKPLKKRTELYNSAVLINNDSFSIYHKSKLVPGAEYLPRPLKFLNRVFLKFGGSSVGYVGQADRTVMYTNNDYFRIAPGICYESIYGEFMSRYIKKNASIIVVITDNSWIGDSPGHKQHLFYTTLRAIETRRWVANCTNNGITCFINPAGRIIDPQPYGKKTAIKMRVPNTTLKTFYVRYGDLISRVAILCAGLFIIVYLVQKLTRKKLYPDTESTLELEHAG